MTTADLDETPFVVRLDHFSGPLDLLLHLIREQEVDIYDIPIAQIARQFHEAIRQLGLNQAAEYLEMAARLLRIKIQLLLPRPLDDDEWEDPRADLVRRLLEYEQYREVAEWMTGQVSARAEQFPRGWVPEAPDSPPPEVVIDLEGVLRAVDQVVATIPEPFVHRVVPRPLNVEKATARIRQLVRTTHRLDFRDIFGPRPHIADVISALIALLEMARLGEVRLTQAEPMRSFTIESEPLNETD